MNWKINRNQKQKYSNEEKLALEEDKNTSALKDIAQEDYSNIFELILLLLLLNVLNTVVFMVRKQKKKAI